MTTPTATTATTRVFDVLRGGLIVSCQAPPEDPLSGPDIMRRLAMSVVAGGAAAVRAEGLEDVRAVRGAVSVPVIGLHKVGTDGVYITPTVAHAKAVAATGADLVAVDATGRPRPDGRALADTVDAVHRLDAGVLADVATVEDGLAAVAAGADAVATTLSGYAGTTSARRGPDLALVAELAERVKVPVIAEGRYRTEADVRAGRAAGAWAVVVGTAITRPQVLTRALVDALSAEGP